MSKSRLEELFDADIDYSLPINAFANKAKALFNKMAKAANLKTRIHAAEYNDGGARLYVRHGYDSLSGLAGLLSVFALNVELLASENRKLMKLELPVVGVTMGGDEITVNF